jgi:hypothetical protein
MKVLLSLFIKLITRFCILEFLELSLSTHWPLIISCFFFFQLLGGKDCMEQQLDSSETLSSAGLALHYAHIIAKIDNAVCFRSLFNCTCDI